MHLTLRPTTIGSSGQRYAAVLPDGRVIATSRTPFFAAARALLAEGSDPAEELTASHVGSPIMAMSASIGWAAQWAISESDRDGLARRPWQPFASGEDDGDGAAEAEIESRAQDADSCPSEAPKGARRARRQGDGPSGTARPGAVPARADADALALALAS